MAQPDNPVILVVEDDPPVRELIDDVLREEGYDVVVAHDGASALRVLESLKVDLITLDLDLPGLTGSDFLRLLQRRKIKIPPVVMVTSHTPVGRQLRKMAQAVVAKPFDIDDLLASIMELVPPPRVVVRQQVEVNQEGASRTVKVTRSTDKT
jgi:DNA-binding response OmpR family regulator